MSPVMGTNNYGWYQLEEKRCFVEYFRFFREKLCTLSTIKSTEKKNELNKECGGIKNELHTVHYFDFFEALRKVRYVSGM